MTTIFTNFADAVLDFFAPKPTTDPIVRLFEIEYAKEYKMLQRGGVEIDRKLALEHINNKM